VNLIPIDYETEYVSGKFDGDVEKETLKSYSKATFIHGNETRKTNEDWFFNGGILVSPDSSNDKMTVYTSVNT
jgi:hypothetical protein